MLAREPHPYDGGQVRGEVRDDSGPRSSREQPVERHRSGKPSAGDVSGAGRLHLAFMVPDSPRRWEGRSHLELYLGSRERTASILRRCGTIVEIRYEVNSPFRRRVIDQMERYGFAGRIYRLRAQANRRFRDADRIS